MTILHHSTLGTIQGKSNHGVVQYLGIKYASLKHRFGPAELYNGPGTSVAIDATQLGPAVTGAPKGCAAEYVLIQQHLPLPKFPPDSDTEGLNLSVTVPETGNSKPLPVFVFIHGGGLATGSGTWPQYDHAAIVRRSAELGKPVIGINFNYRTGAFGFLSSDELTGAGFQANNGLRDQKVAFQWVKKFISGFGGDPEQITAVGQSAGGVSTTLLLQSPEPLFNRLVAMSGTCLAMRPAPRSIHNHIYQQFCKFHGLVEVCGEERVQALDRIDSRELILKTPPFIPSLPAVDDFIHNPLTFETIEDWSSEDDPAIHGLVWCKELLIGDCQLDGSIYQLALAHRQRDIAKQFEDSLKRSIPGRESEIDNLLSEYSISTAKDDETAYLRILEFATDIHYYLPTENFSRYWPGTKYVYHLNEPNPWEGPFKGRTTHILDVAFLFQNYHHELEPPVATVSQSFGDSFITFVNGEAPWKVSTTDKPVAYVYQGDASELKEDRPDIVGRRDTIFRFKDSIGFDTLYQAFTGFLGGA